MNEKKRENSSGIVSVSPGEKAVFVHQTKKGLEEMELRVHGTLGKALEGKKLSKETLAALNHPDISPGMVKGLVIGRIPETQRLAVMGSAYGVGEKKGKPYYNIGSIKPLIQPAERTERVKALITKIVREAYSSGLVFFPDIIAKK